MNDVNDEENDGKNTNKTKWSFNRARTNRQRDRRGQCNRINAFDSTLPT